MVPLLVSRSLFWRLVNAHYLTTSHREGLFFTEHQGLELCTTEAPS